MVGALLGCRGSYVSLCTVGSPTTVTGEITLRYSDSQLSDVDFADSASNYFINLGVRTPVAYKSVYKY